MSMFGEFAKAIARIVGRQEDRLPSPRRTPRVETTPIRKWTEGREPIDCDGLAGQVVQIVYESASGDETDRRIRCSGLSRSNGKIYLDAYCLERAAPRMFRLDRMSDVTDLATGEVFDSAPAWLNSIGIEVTDVGSDGQDLLKSWSKVRDGAVALMYLARYDGETHHAEVRLVFDFVRQRLTVDSGSPAPEDEIVACAARAMGLFPSDDELMAAIEQLRGRAHDRQIAVVLNMMEDLAAADGVRRKTEKELIEAFRFAVTAGRDADNINRYQSELRGLSWS